MTIGTAIAAALPRLRAQAESMMTETCTITRDSAQTFNSTTGAYSATTTTVYTGKCRVKPRSSFMRERVAEVGEQAEYLWPYIVTLPLTATDVEVGDLLTVTASSDASLVDRTMRVRIAARGENITARRLDCEETAPGG